MKSEEEELRSRLKQLKHNREVELMDPNCSKLYVSDLDASIKSVEKSLERFITPKRVVNV